MVEHTQLPKFDAGNWVKVARLAVAASVALSAVTVAILLMVDPPISVQTGTSRTHTRLRCGRTSLCLRCPSIFFVVSWPFVGTGSREAQLRAKRDEGLFGHMTPPAIPVTHIMVHMCV